MSDDKYVYVIYIAAPAEKIWKGLLEGEFTRQYWRHDNVSDWKPGSKWQHRRSDGSGVVDIVGEVVESKPPRRLVMTWAYANDENDKSRHTRVALDLEPVGDMVRLTVTHDEFKAGDMRSRIAMGWPRVLSSLKSLLETGRPLDTWAGMPAR